MTLALYIEPYHRACICAICMTLHRSAMLHVRYQLHYRRTIHGGRFLAVFRTTMQTLSASNSVQPERSDEQIAPLWDLLSQTTVSDE